MLGILYYPSSFVGTVLIFVEELVVGGSAADVSIAAAILAVSKTVVSLSLSWSVGVVSSSPVDEGSEAEVAAGEC